MTQIIRGLTKEEKQSMVKMITGEFVLGMNPTDRKEMVETIVPLMIAQMGSVKADSHEKKENRLHVATRENNH